MPTLADRGRQLLPSSLTGLAGAACAACCVLPLLLAAGVLSGAGWAVAVAWMPGIAVAFAGLAGITWWWTRRRHQAGCAGGNCACVRPRRSAHWSASTTIPALCAALPQPRTRGHRHDGHHPGDRVTQAGAGARFGAGRKNRNNTPAAYAIQTATSSTVAAGVMLIVAASSVPYQDVGSIVPDTS